VSVNIDKEDEARKIFSKLSVGGEVFFPIDKVPWGAIFGMVTDKYGVEWMVNCEIKK
jgi:PhnB protein